MQVDGWISINPEGGVAEFQTETPLLPALHENLERVVLKWRFQPVMIDGVPRMVRAKTRVILARNRVGKVYVVKVDNVTFPNNPDAKAETIKESPQPITALSMQPPNWPRGLLGANVSGQVLLYIRVGADGRAEQVVAVQSMLFDVKGKNSVLRDVIDQFERSALLGATHWRFNVPADRGQMSAENRTVSVPVVFLMEKRPELELPGRWRTIVRNPTRPVEWLPKSPDVKQAGVTDVAAGELMSASSEAKLNTDVVGMIVM